MAGAALAVAASVWQGRQTAEIVADLVKWRLEVATPELSRLRANVSHNTGEIGRLRDLREGV
jgi:hypothetical protein